MLSESSMVVLSSSVVPRKIFYILALFVCIWLIGDSSWNVFSALKLHEPSYRIFRSLLEINLVFWGATVSLFLWRKTIGQDAVENLLFPKVLSYDQIYEEEIAYDKSRQQQQQQQQQHASRKGFVGVMDDGVQVLDADYAEDGDVPIPTPKEPLITDGELANLSFDMLLYILVTLFLFTLSSSRETGETEYSTINAFWNLYSRIAAPTFPLILFLYFLHGAFFPWNSNRRNFWILVSHTMAAPWFPVAFRDGFLGDIITSIVRPLQDVCFTIFYILFGLQGWWSTKEYRDIGFLGWADAKVPIMEKSWIVHTVVLPLCTASPLWWRFLQNLRQAYDERRRWPYLGNAFKYFLAAQVAMIGVFYPGKQNDIVWFTSFIVATMYQCWWDVFMDWQLLDSKGHLRSQRLYNSKTFYLVIAWVNLLLRFCWTLSFLPLQYLNDKGVLTENFSGDLGSHILAPAIASAEIIRRTIWGFLRFEWEAIKALGKGDPEESPLQAGANQDTDLIIRSTELQPMVVGESNSRNRSSYFLGDMSLKNPIQVIGELGLYATTFCIICLVMAAHRETF